MRVSREFAALPEYCAEREWNVAALADCRNYRDMRMYTGPVRPIGLLQCTPPLPDRSTPVHTNLARTEYWPAYTVAPFGPHLQQLWLDQ